MEKKERRSFPRVQENNLAVSLKTDGADIVAYTLNLSASGVYCKTEKELPLMSRIGLTLMVPEVEKNQEPSKIEVSGVVVREHPVVINNVIKHYDVAIFFEDLSDTNREIILKYITKNPTVPEGAKGGGV